LTINQHFHIKHTGLTG